MDARLWMPLWGLFCLVSGLLDPEPTAGPESPEDLQVRCGDSVLLRCRCLGAGRITALKWLRSDLTDYVFFHRDRRPYERYQNERYRGRVRLADPAMSGRNLSVVLLDAGLEDAGTYRCEVGLAGGPRAQTVHAIRLLVAPPQGPTDGPSERTGSGAALMVAVPVLLAGGVITAAVIVCRRRNDGDGDPPGWH